MANSKVEPYEPPRLEVIGHVADLTKDPDPCSISTADFCIGTK